MLIIAQMRSVSGGYDRQRLRRSWRGVRAEEPTVLLQNRPLRRQQRWMRRQLGLLQLRGDLHVN